MMICWFERIFKLNSKTTKFNVSLSLSKDDPLRFVFWKRRLREVRELLKADALEKLKQSCPTLFALGWFNENKPKDEQVLRAEDEDLAREAAVVAAGQTEFTRERQLADNVFIRL